MPIHPAHRLSTFSASVFTEITQLALKHQAVDLSTGYPDADGPEEAKAAAIAAIQQGRNQYALSHGEPDLRRAVAEHARRFYGQAVDAESGVTITNGAAEALHTVMDALVNPGDEVILFEPFYEVYAPNVIMAGGVPRFVPLRPPDWAFDPEELARAFTPQTRAVVVNSPHNPTGKVNSLEEMQLIARLCQEWDVAAITDEVYEHIVYDGRRHFRLAALPGMMDRTLTISSLSKTFGFTGWRIGWVIAPAALTQAVRLAHQYVLDCSATPLQLGAAAALSMPDAAFTSLAAEYQAKRDYLAQALGEAGLEVSLPDGAFFIMAGINGLGFDDDFAFCRHLAARVGVAAIPPSAFYTQGHRELGRSYARFAFCKTWDRLKEARERLANTRGSLNA